MLRIFSKNKNFIALALVFMSVLACNENTRQADVSDVALDIPVVRFEQELFSINGAGAFKTLDGLEKKHKTFYDLFTKYVIRSADKSDSLSKINLLNFVNDKDIQQVYKQTSGQYGDFSEIQNELTDAFKHYKKEFPAKIVPAIYTYISGFNYAVISADSLLGIGLDMYLGADSKYYPALGLPKYKTNNMRREYIVSDAVKGWAQSEYPADEKKKDFLSHIIYAGKLLYFQDALLSVTPDSVKIGYTADQLLWCQKSEASIWAFLISKKVLYSGNYTEYHKFISEGPGTNGFPPEAPSLLGNWIGWQIVRKYMAENKNVSLNQLMNEPDAQKVLTLSKYKPGK